ncbi:MAG TPA: hypothetical protein VEX68_28425 [Bryobacteraceae bacterium]|nr:hypothetical protein [Bryobacteraceae bacterium]
MTACAFVVLIGVLGTSAFGAEELSTYRGFRLGMDLSAAAKQAGIEASEAKPVHQRPALIQKLDWQPGALGYSGDKDTIKEGSLSFYDGALYRIVVTYDRDRVEGLTTDDMIAAISSTYGIATRPKADIAYHSNYAEMAQVIARWQDSQYSFNLVRSGYGDSFALVMYSKRLDALAATAITEAARLDAIEAPERAIEASRKQEQDDRLSLEKARLVNARNFKP